MKRLLLTFLLLFTAALVFAQNIEVVIQRITGMVELKKPGLADWEAANIGDRLERSTVISTGIRSTAVLAVGKSTITVRPITRLSLQSLLSSEKTETIDVRLATGRIQVKVTPPAGKRSSFMVRSASSFASVRGTSFEMDMTGIRVLEGTVSYTPVDSLDLRSVTVSAGQEAWVDADTGNAITPMAAAEISRSPPSLPGQNAGTIPESNAQLGAELYSFEVQIIYE